MDKMRKILQKVFVLPARLTVLISVPSFFALIGYFLYLSADENYKWLAIPLYCLSAYALIIVCTGAGRIGKRINQLLSNVKIWNRYRNDVYFRTTVNMGPGIIFNAIYIISNFWLAHQNKSSWFLFLGIYYFILVSMKSRMLKGLVQRRNIENLKKEYRDYRFCGVSLFILNFAMIAMSVFIVKRHQSYTYDGVLIYGIAAVAFYNITLAIINVMKYRKSKNPTIFAVKVINLTTAMVTLFALETAMLSQFGGDASPEFRYMITSISAGIICLVEFILAVRMIYTGNQLICKIEKKGA